MEYQISKEHKISVSNRIGKKERNIMAQQITTFIKNEPGTLAAFCTLLKNSGVDMRAMNVSDAMDFGIVRVIVSNTAAAEKVLTENGYVCQKQDVLAIEVQDHPGSLVELLTILGDAGVNLEYTYALFSRHEGTAGFVIKTTDRAHAESALSKAGIKTLAEEEL